MFLYIKDETDITSKQINNLWKEMFLYFEGVLFNTLITSLKVRLFNSTQVTNYQIN